MELAKQLGNVSRACKIMGYSRDSFYYFQGLYEKGGEAALIEMSRRQPNIRTRVATEIEKSVIALVIEQPAWGLLGSVLLLTGLASIVVFQLTPRYSAETVLMIEPRQSKVVDLEAVIEGLP